MASRRFFQANGVGLGIFHLFRAIRAIFAYLHAGEYVAAALRFEPIQLRGGQAAAAAFANFTAIASFGLLVDGCRRPPTIPLEPWQGGVGAASAVGGSGLGGVVARYGDAIRAHGYYWTTAAAVSAGAELDPVGWSVFSSSESAYNGSDWAAIGASVWRLDPLSDGSLQLYPQLPFPTPAAGPNGVDVVVDHRPPWQWVMLAIAVNFNNAGCFLACVVAGVAGQGHRAQAIWAWMFIFALLQDAASAAVHLAMGQVREGVARLLFFPENLIMVVGILKWPSRVMEFLFIYGVLGVAVRCATDFGLYRSPPLLFLGVTALSSPSAGLFVSSLVLSLRFLDIPRAHQLVAPDCDRYDAAGDEVLSDPARHADINTIKALTDQLAARSWWTRPRQYNRRRPPPAAATEAAANTASAAANGMRAGISLRRMLGTPLRRSDASIAAGGSMWLFRTGSLKRHGGPSPEMDIRRPVDCVDQLCVQAWLLNPILIRKVQRWATSSGGCFRFSGDGFVRCWVMLYAMRLARGRGVMVNFWILSTKGE
jgi:hypothetical protein